MLVTRPSRVSSSLVKLQFLRCIYVFSPDRRINRYYDPSTGQFLSIDPKVATTDQPYVFTNDNPLNATDPLGLKGSPGTTCIDKGTKACNTQIKKYDAAAAKAGSGFGQFATFAVVLLTIPLDEFGAGEEIDSVVIGEDMANRVQPIADQLNAGTFEPSSSNLTSGELMKENTDWINSCMDAGMTIYDCGAAPGRANFPGATSKFYKMELDQIAARQYQNVVRINMGH